MVAKDIRAGKEAAALALRLEDAGTSAYWNQQEKPPVWDVIVLDDPALVDLRQLAPEAFTYHPDGFWRGGINHWCLVAGRFPAYDQALTFATQLKERGLTIGHVGGPDRHFSDLYFAEAMIKLFGCTPAATWTDPPERFPEGVALRREAYIGYHLSKNGTGTAKYTAAAASLSRAFDRLEARELINRLGVAYADRPWRCSSIDLTEHGIELASELMVNQPANVPLVNHYSQAVST